MADNYPVVSQTFPFDLEFQKGLLRLLCEDSRFAHLVAGYLEPKYFESEVLQWAWNTAKQFAGTYGAYPTVHTLKQYVHQLDPKIRGIYDLTLEQVGGIRLRDEAWLRDAVLDFIRRNIFVRAFHDSRAMYNQGQVEKAYDYMMSEMERINKTVWEVADESWFYDDLPARQMARLSADQSSSNIATGFDKLDMMLHGGLSKGELGIWVGYAKGGKSTLLMTLGVAATKFQFRPTAHFVFEGSRKQVEDRYESAMTSELYAAIRDGGLSSQKYCQAYQEYQYCRGKLYIRGFTDEWDYSVVDIHSTLKDLKKTHNWIPDMVIVDYGDLLQGRDRHYPNEREKQKAAFRDLKSLSNRGYAVWTASQAQRPDEGCETSPHWIYTRMISECYEKVRIADFLGSINSSAQERQEGILRILGEMYRDNAADVRFNCPANLAKMYIGNDPTLQNRWMPDLWADIRMGVQRQQVQESDKLVNAPTSKQPVQTYAPLK